MGASEALRSARDGAPSDTVGLFVMGHRSRHLPERPDPFQVKSEEPISRRKTRATRATLIAPFERYRGERSGVRLDSFTRATAGRRSSPAARRRSIRAPAR